MADAEAIYLSKPTQDEIADVLAQRLTTTIGTLNPDGTIHLAYVIFLFEDGRLYFETSSITRKAKNAAQRSTASFIVEGQASSGRSLMVGAEGRARVLTGAEAHAINQRLRAKYVTEAALDGVNRVWGAVDDVSVEITPHRWRSWTGDVLHAATQEALGEVPYKEAWRRD